MGMNKVCTLCQGKLKDHLLLKNMPVSAQGFRETQKEAFEASGNMKIFECSFCGLTQYIGPKVPYYQEVIRSTRLSVPMLEYRTKQFQDIVSLYGIDNVFELGAGSGEYLDVFKSIGVRTFGIEGASKLAKKARDVKHDVFDGFLPGTDLSVHLEPNYFDLVTSFNFVEHLPDPIASLRCLNNFLKPGGLALLEVPNFDMISEFGLFNEFIPDHRLYFTEHTFRLLLSLSGFEVLKVETSWGDYILSALATKRPLARWDVYYQSQDALHKAVVSFFDGSHKKNNAVWSAGHQSLATISSLNLAGLISCMIDSSPDKQNTFAPGSGLPICAPDVLLKGDINRILLAAAGFNPEIARIIRAKYGDEMKIGFLDKGTVKSG